MCRTTDYHGPYEPGLDHLCVKAFYLRLRLKLLLSGSNQNDPLPDSLTLCYLPRIDASPLEINGSRIPPNSTAFLTLHRAITEVSGYAVFGCRDRVCASEGARFEVYVGEERLLKGVFMRGGDILEEWRMECKCVLEREMTGVSTKEAEVCVAVEGVRGTLALREKVAVVVVKRRCWTTFKGLEEIPEGREEAESDDEYCCCCCCCDEGESQSDDGDLFDGNPTDLFDGNPTDVKVMNVQGVSWAVDVGIWIMCLGVGYLVSRASVKTFRRRKIC